MNRRRIVRAAGFTLVELILVITILGILAGVVAVNVKGTTGRAKERATRTQITNLESAMETFEINMGRYPTTDEGLKALVENPDGSPDWTGPYVKSKTVPKDSWNHDFVYNPDGERGLYYDLYSLGPDNQEGTDDDIGNWSKDENGR